MIDVNIDCAVKLIGTNCIIYPVNSKDLQHIWVSGLCLGCMVSGLLLGWVAVASLLLAASVLPLPVSC